MGIKSRPVFLWVLLGMLFAGYATAFGAQASGAEITKENITAITEIYGSAINGSLPFISSTGDLDFENRINTMVGESYRYAQKLLGDNALESRYEVYMDRNIISIVLLFIAGDPQVGQEISVQSIVFDRIAFTELTLKDVLDTQDTAGFTDKDFYVKDGAVTIINNRQIRESGLAEAEESLDFSIRLEYKAGDYFTADGLDFISLAEVKKMGLEIKSNGDGTMDLLSPGGKIVTIAINENSYISYKPEESWKIVLSSEPKLFQGYILCVPIDFFHSVFGAEVTKDGDGVILIEI